MTPPGSGSQTSMLTRYPSYFRNLDALRFYAFLGAFMSHTILLPDTGNMLSEVLLSLMTLHFLGVPFFFSLSGFLISYRLLIEKEKYGDVRLLRFYKNRILRVWPAYYIILLVSFVLLPFVADLLHTKGPTLPAILPFVLFYVNFYIIENGSFFTFALVILWSISIQEQFYILWGMVMKFISNKLTVLTFVTLLAISIAFSFCYLHVYPESSNLLAIHSLFALQNFCTGALAALLYFKRKKSSLRSNLRRMVFASAYVILPVSYLFSKDFIVFNIVKSTCYGLILYDQSFNEQRFFNAGKSTFVNYLGKISYGLYLYHALVMVLLQTQFGFFGYSINPTVVQNLVQSVITLIITFIIAHLSYRYIESKFLALKSA